MDISEELQNTNDLGPANRKVLANLYYTHFWLADKYKTILARYGITAQQSNVLGILLRVHPKQLTLHEVKEMLLEKNADVSRVIDRMVDKKLLTKKLDPANRRKINIAITSEGISLAKKIEEEKLFDKFTSKLTREEAVTLIQLLGKLRVEE